jgi:hypothetical protein
MNRVFVAERPQTDSQQLLRQTGVFAEVIPHRSDEKAAGFMVPPVAVPGV